MGIGEDQGDSEVPAGPSSLKRVLKPVFGVIAIAFVAHAAHRLYSSWDGARVDVNAGLFLASLGPASAAMLLQLAAWRALIKSLTGAEMPARLAARLYLDSQMARYTPGKVGLAIVRIAGAEAVGVPAKVMASALLAEVVSWCGMGAVVGGVGLSLVPHSGAVAQKLSLGSVIIASGAAVLVVVSASVSSERYPAKIRALFGVTSAGPLVPWVLPALHLVHFVCWIACGALVALSVGAPLSAALVAGALLCLAIVAGFLALLAPAGAGVREAVLAAGLAPVVGPTLSVTVGLLARISSLLSDAFVWAWCRARAR